MRRQSIAWTYLVISVLLILYGGYFVISGNKYGGNIYVSAIIALSIGSIMMLIFLILSTIDRINNKKDEKNKKVQEENKIVEEEFTIENEVETPKEKVIEEKKSEPEEIKVVESPKPSSPSYSRSIKKENMSRPYYGYISELGVGPIIDINGFRIRDMRSNTYYRLESNCVYSDYGGLVYVIEGNVIRSVGRGYLYEISGGDVYKVYGGYFASFSGNHISLYDNSKIYEYGGGMSIELKLVITVILFGEY